MLEYYFLFALAFVWIIFAIVQDLRTTEVANWLSFSLIAFVLAYRAFYAVFSKDVMFFIYGLLGVLMFVVLAYGFYYSKVFGGGDVKLLMGFGGIFPYGSAVDYLILGAGFIFLLFAAGAIWTLTYSLFLIRKNKRKFKKEFKREFVRGKKWFYFTAILIAVLAFFLFFYDLTYVLWPFLFFLIFPFLYVYVKAIERSCMIKLVEPSKLIVGDWLESEIKVGKRVIKKSVHGLSLEEINLLRKFKKKARIKGGVPFTPAFLIALLIMFFLLWNSPF